MKNFSEYSVAIYCFLEFWIHFFFIQNIILLSCPYSASIFLVVLSPMVSMDLIASRIVPPFFVFFVFPNGGLL
jgi:hypothetical protein